MLNTLPYEYEQDGGEGRAAWGGGGKGSEKHGGTHTDCPYSKLLPVWVLRKKPCPKSTNRWEEEMPACRRLGVAMTDLISALRRPRTYHT